MEKGRYKIKKSTYIGKYITFVEYDSTWKNNTHDYKRYRVHFANKYIKQDKYFKTLEEAQKFVEQVLGDKEIQEQQNIKKIKAPVKRDLLYPYNVLKAIGVSFDDPNFGEIMENFETRANYVFDNSHLTEKTKEIFWRRVKNPKDERNLITNIAKELNVTKQRVQQIEQNAVAMLKGSADYIITGIDLTNVSEIARKKAQEYLSHFYGIELVNECKRILKEHSALKKTRDQSERLEKYFSSSRIIDTLHQVDIWTLSELKAKGEQFIMDLPNCGERIKEKIIKVLKEN